MRAFCMLALLALVPGPALPAAPDEISPAPAPEPEPAPIGVIHEMEGRVSITRAGDPEAVTAEEDMELGIGDRINTGPGGSVTVSLRDEHFVKLGERADMTIKELRSDQVAGGMWARISLATGKLMAAVASLTSLDSRFEVETPTAVAAVKGTTFQVSAGRGTTTISVLEGAVAASGPRNAAVLPEELEVKEGYETVVDSKTHRPGALLKFFKNERRKKSRMLLSEFRARSQQLRSKGQSGELRRQRRLRVLGRALLIRRFKEKNPAAYRGLPAWRRDRLDRFLTAHKPELDGNRAEISRFLNSSPKTRKKLEQQVQTRFAGAKTGSPRRSVKAGGTGKAPARRQKDAGQARQP